MSAYDDLIIADGAIGVYRMESGAGGVDSSGNGYDGTPTGTIVYGEPGIPAGGSSIKLVNSTPGYINITASEIKSLPTGSFSAEYWAKCTTAVHNQASMSWYGADDLILYGYDSFDHDVYGVRAFWRNRGGNVGNDGSGSTRANGNWYLFGASYDASANSFVLSVNGVAVVTGTPAAGTSAFTGLSIGTYQEATAQTFNGWLARVAVYNSAVSLTTFASHYAAGMTAPSTSASLLLARRRFMFRS